MCGRNERREKEKGEDIGKMMVNNTDHSKMLFVPSFLVLLFPVQEFVC